MTLVFTLEQIKNTIEPAKLIDGQERAFAAYSAGTVVVPPVGYLRFEEPAGDCHIKYGYVKNDKYFVVKIATGFSKNSRLGLSVGDGMMALFNQSTGKLEAILLDEGYLTDIRTAAAGAVAARYLAPKKIKRIGIVGTGVQARMQLKMLSHATGCKSVMVWGRDKNKREQYKTEMTAAGFSVQPVEQIKELAQNCNLIVTTTSSREPLLHAAEIQPGTHITAVGADAEGKQELEAQVFERADVCAVDSILQCIDHGDASHAIEAGVIDKNKLIELGEIILNPKFNSAWIPGFQ